MFSFDGLIEFPLAVLAYNSSAAASIFCLVFICQVFFSISLTVVATSREPLRGEILEGLALAVPVMGLL